MGLGHLLSASEKPRNPQARRDCPTRKKGQSDPTHVFYWAGVPSLWTCIYSPTAGTGLTGLFSLHPPSQLLGLRWAVGDPQQLLLIHFCISHWADGEMPIVPTEKDYRIFTIIPTLLHELFYHFHAINIPISSDLSPKRPSKYYCSTTCAQR